MGLGFDPTQNMDMVIQSPSARIEPKNQLDAVDFGSLGLEPPLSSTAVASAANARNHNHIFAFGSSATWGTASDSNDWGAPSSNAPAASRLLGGILGAGGSFDGAESNTSDGDPFLAPFAASSGPTWSGAGAPGGISNNSVGGGDQAAND